MLRATVCAVMVAVIAPAARAGELDNEAAPVAKAPAVAAAAPGGSEMDRESPQAAHGWRWGGHWGPRWGWGGFYPARFSYFNIGFGSPFYRPFGFSFGFGYRPFFPAYYYAPFGYWWW